MGELKQELPAYKMWRPDVPLADIAVPEGYRLRLLRDDEGEAWCACCLNDMGVDEISQKLFKEKMLDDPSVPPFSVFCIEDADGVPVATATAQIKDGSTANLHMIAAREDMRGKGLGLPVCAAALHKHRNEGRMECQLTTHDWRLGAIKHYIRLGFIPVLNHESARSRWETTVAKLGIVSLSCVSEKYATVEDIIAKTT